MPSDVFVDVCVVAALVRAGGGVAVGVDLYFGTVGVDPPLVFRVRGVCSSKPVAYEKLLRFSDAHSLHLWQLFCGRGASREPQRIQPDRRIARIAIDGAAAREPYRILSSVFA
jgi:hypothetical protein